MSRTANLVIKLTAGLEAPERVSQAFSVASAALASGVNVSFWLTGDAAYFAVPGKADEFELPHAAPLADQLAALVSGARVVLCSQCAVRRNINDGDQIKELLLKAPHHLLKKLRAKARKQFVY
jgi:predicted peroxiredoxin